MDCIGYRISGELSDITVVVDGEEFHLHKFPLFVRSNYFKNLSSLQDTTRPKSRVGLDNFPGGARTFEIIADYCYNKEVDVNLNNVVSVKCAAEYLDMAGGSGRGGLVMLADNVLFDLTYSAKTKRDFYLPLVLLDKSSQYKKHAENSGLSQKLIDSVVENLNNFLKSAAVYENIEVDPKKSKKTRISLSEDSIKILNNLPLDWMNELIRSSARVGLSPSTLSVIIENYIDYNTGLNPHNEKKTENLVSITAAILKAESRFQDESKVDNLKDIASDVLSQEPKNLISIASDILEPSPNLKSMVGDILENKTSNLVSIASDILEPSSNLKNIAGDILEPTSNLKQIAGEVLDDNRPEQLISIAASIFKVDNKMKETENLKDMAGDILAHEPKNLINIAADILEPKPENLVAIAGDILKNKNLSKDEKLRVIEELTRTLVEVRLEPEFSISWLLIYMNVLHELNADSSVRSAFNSWTWNAINDLKSNSKELSSVPPSVMVDLSKDISQRDSVNSGKLIDLVDRYMSELNSENRLNTDTFIDLAKSIPKEKRNSFDGLTKIVIDLLKKESHNINSDKQNELLNLIDFNKLNENTLEECEKCEFIPQKYVTRAAINLCGKLRKELEDAKMLAKSFEPSKTSPLRTQTKVDPEPAYTTKYTSPRYSTSNRLDDKISNDDKKYTSTTSNTKTTYTLPITTTTTTSNYNYTYPKYNNNTSSYKPKTSSKDTNNYIYKTKNTYSKSYYQTYRHNYHHNTDCLDTNNGLFDAYDYADYMDDDDSTATYTSSYYGYSSRIY